MYHDSSFLTLIKSNLVKEGMDINDGEAWKYNIINIIKMGRLCEKGIQNMGRF